MQLLDCHTESLRPEMCVSWSSLVRKKKARNGETSRLGHAMGPLDQKDHGWRYSSQVQPFTSMHETLGSIDHTTNQK